MRLSTGTVTVANGETAVTAWLGDDDVVLSEITAPAGSAVVIEGCANFIAERSSTTTFSLLLPHAGAGGSGLATAINAAAAAETQVATLNARTARVIQELSTLDANGRGLFFNLIGVTGDNDPGPGRMAFNAGVPDDVTEIYFDVLDANEGGRDVTGLLGLWKAGTVLIVRSLASTAYAAFQISSTPDATPGYRRITVVFVGSSGALAEEPVGVEWVILGEGIEIGRTGPFAERAGFDDAPAGFIYASVDGDGDEITTSVLFQKRSAASADWSPALPFEGRKGDKGDIGDMGPIGPRGITPRGSYDDEAEYDEGDSVLDHGSTWAALQTTTGNAPPVLPTTSNAWWQLLARAGEDGAGTGDVKGPVSSVAGRIAVFKDGTGKEIEDSGKTLAELEPADGSVGNAKLADMAEATVKGRSSGDGSGAPQDLTAAQARKFLGPRSKSAPLYTSDALLTNPITLGNSTPTSSMGTEIQTVEFAANSATSKVVVEFHASGSHASSDSALLAILLVDSETTARATSLPVNPPPAPGGIGYLTPLFLRYEWVPGDTLPHIYRIRVGAGGGSMRLNVSGASMGGTVGATLTAEDTGEPP